MEAFTEITASSSAQRSLEKTSGLFDKELTGVRTESLTSVDDFDVTMTEGGTELLSPDDLYNIIHKEGEAILGNSDDISWLGQPGDLDLEEFTDLSDFLLGEEAMETEPSVDDEVFDLPTTSTGGSTTPAPGVSTSSTTGGSVAVTSTRGLKREAPEDPEPSTLEVSTIIPADHCSYTTKIKRSRFSSVTSTSDTESCVGSTTTSKTREEKYIERRTKNNIASRRSRQTRKQKFQSMEEKATELEESNAELRQRVVLLEEMAKEMKELLIQRMSQK